MLVTDLILEKPNPWIDLYDPTRKPVRSLQEIVKEGVNVAVQDTKKILPAPAKGVADIPLEGGAIVDTDGGKLAI
jgi:hypothetical protein